MYIFECSGGHETQTGSATIVKFAPFDEIVDDANAFPLQLEWRAERSQTAFHVERYDGEILNAPSVKIIKDRAEFLKSGPTCVGNGDVECNVNAPRP
jgi:hypothetical protein